MLATAFSTCGVSLICKPADAQIAVVCPTCSNLVTQLIQDGRAAASYAKQVQQYVLQLQQWVIEVQNITRLPAEIWETVQNDIGQVMSIAQGASLLINGSGSMLQRLNAAGSYANRIANLPLMLNQFGVYQQTMGNALTRFGQLVGLQQTQDARNANILAAVQAHSATAIGQLQVMQAGVEYSNSIASELLGIQNTLLASAQMVGAQMAEEADRQATEDAWMNHFFSIDPPAFAGNPRY